MSEISLDRGINSATEAAEDATGGVRMRHPNVTVHHSQVRYERNLRLKAMHSHFSLNSFFPYNPMTVGAVDEVILPTLPENHASDLCFDESVLVEMQGIFSLCNDDCVGEQSRQMNLATRKGPLKFDKSF